MAFKQYEQKPPRLEAMLYDGSNAKEIGQLYGAETTTGLDDNGEYLETHEATWMGPRPVRMYVGDFIVRQGDQLRVEPGEAFTTGYREI